MLSVAPLLVSFHIVESGIWTNESSCWLFFTCEDETYQCSGDINKTYYNYTNSYLRSEDDDGICGLDFASDNATICTDIGCTYGYIQAHSEFGKANVFSLISDLASFNVDLGIPEAYLWMFTFIFFYVPLIFLLIAGYFAIPLIH